MHTSIQLFIVLVTLALRPINCWHSIRIKTGRFDSKHKSTLTHSPIFRNFGQHRSASLLKASRSNAEGEVNNPEPENENNKQNGDSEDGMDGTEQTEVEEEESIAEASEVSLENLEQLLNNATSAIINSGENVTVEIVEPKSPKELATEAYALKLKQELASAESMLRAMRFESTKLRDQLDESGKPGFFMVQAKVNDFLRKKDSDLKELVKKNKRDFVERIIPVIDAFFVASKTATATTERETNMLKSFGSLLNSILKVLEKFGYTIFIAEEGEVVDSSKHHVVEYHTVEDEELPSPVVIELIGRGIRDDEGKVLRKANVKAKKGKELPPPPLVAAVVENVEIQDEQLIENTEDGEENVDEEEEEEEESDDSTSEDGQQSEE